MRLEKSVFLVLVLLWVFPVMAEPVFVPGSRIGLTPPPGFVPSNTFKGFESVAEGGSILIVEMPPQAYASVSTVSDSVWATKGIAVDSRTSLKIGDAPAVFLRGRQDASGITFSKWILIVGFDDVTALVTVQAPAAIPGDRQIAIERSLHTLQQRLPPTLDQKIAALPFTVGSTADMRVLNVVAGNGVVLTRGPKDLIEGAEQPLLIIVRSFNRAYPAGVTAEVISRQAVANFAPVEGIAIESTSDVGFAGGKGFEIVARARLSETGEPVAVIQWVTMLDGAYLRMIGIANTETRVSDFKAFGEIRDGIRPK